MPTHWFTADHHAGHAKIIEYCRRPFRDTHEMDEAMINNHNSVVQSDDFVYILGDVAFKNPANYIRRLNGHKFIIRGNHDKYIEECKSLVGWIRYFQQITVEGQKIVLMHYAMRVWPSSHHGAYQLYGHSHGTLEDDPNALSIDVGVDCHNFFPISFKQVQAKMANKNFKPVDHHNAKTND